MMYNDSTDLEGILPVSACNALRNCGVQTFGDLKIFMETMTPEKLHLVPNFERKSYNAAMVAVGGRFVQSTHGRYKSERQMRLIGPVAPQKSHIEAAERLGKVYAERQSGKTFREIGEALGVGKARAGQLYAKAERALERGGWRTSYIKATA